jgi:ABC-type phosphate transport system substrate-binding protein
MKSRLYSIGGFLALLAFATTSVAAEVAVIANKSVPVKTIDSQTLMDLYTGDIRSWGDGQPVVLIDLKLKTEIKDVFYGYLGTSSSRMRSIWMRNMLAGEAKPPQSIGSEAELLQMVASTPGAIGYVSVPTARSAAQGDFVTLIVIDSESDK